MISQKLRKVGNSYVVTIPREEVERRGLREGQLLAIDITPLELKPVVSTELREAFEASWQRNEQAYRYLGEN